MKIRSVIGMLKKTAFITFLSTLVIAALALTVEQSGTYFGPQPPVAMTGASPTWNANSGRGDWGTGAMGVTGASGSYYGGGVRSNWGAGTMGVTGASRGYSGGGDHDDWDDDDHGGWDGDDD